jgi:ribosomal protein L16 Arg81 hydroxylase
MSIELKPVDSVKNISRKDFQQNFLEKQLPLKIREPIIGGPATDNWTIDYLKKKGGSVKVDLFGHEDTQQDKVRMSPETSMTFGDYLDLITTGPTDLRMFLFNVFDHIPELKSELEFPDIMDGFLTKFPFLFFGGTGSSVRLHFDIDMSNVFIYQFHGIKRILLFAPEYSERLYRLPLSFHSKVKPDNPDYKKYPALDGVKGYECYLEKGESLFMPSGYWHYIQYLEGGFSLSMRTLSKSMLDRIRGAVNLSLVMNIDNLLRNLGPGWFRFKEKWANANAVKYIS